MGDKLKLSEQFEKDLEAAYAQVEGDEWVVSRLREWLCSGASAVVAFDNVVDVLRIAERNPDMLLDCCWMALALARQSQTTQIPDGLVPVLEHLSRLAKDQQISTEVEAIYAWYRIQPNYSFNPDALKRAG